MRKETKVFGLTGNIGTGKSTVAWMFQELGVPAIDADEIAHEAIAPHTGVWDNIFKRYGKTVLLKDDIVDRRELARIIFDDPAERRFLESLIHPYVRSEIAHRTARLAKERHPFLIVDTPLLFEAGWEREFDAIIVVRCDQEQEIQRCRDKFGLGRDEVMKRIAALYPLSRKTDAADAVIDNDGTIEETRVQVRRLHHEMVSGRFPKGA